MQGRGFGTALFEASLARAMRDEVNVLIGETAPVASGTDRHDTDAPH
jgi:hypothetical protein